MLAKMVIKNFLSFREETTLDFTRTKYESLETENISDSGILKGILFVGGNASGKSNIIRAIRYVLDSLFGKDEVSFEAIPCFFSGETEVSLDYYFLIDNSEVRYLVQQDRSKDVIIEKLFLNGAVKFERMGLSAKSFIGENETIYGKDDLDSKTLSLRKLFFDTSRFAGEDILQRWFDYLRNSIYFNASEKKVISYDKNDFTIINHLEKEGVNKINDFLGEINYTQTVEYERTKQFNVSADGKPMLVYQFSSGKDKTVFLKRKDVDVSIPLLIESTGNQTLLNMLPSFLHIAEGRGMLIIDEFSSGFHNELEQVMVEYFMKTSNSSQLFLVSHSTNLLSTTLLRPDQIYSVRFDGNNGSKINRFSNEKPRFAQNIEKMYLSGVFSGIPDYTIMIWST